jgi:L-glyceraldehyde 3-phosphate reductase
VGVSSVEQLEANVAAAGRLDFDEAELVEIDRHATDSGINIWSDSSRE